MAEDALARAREIAAKLSGKFTALNNNTFMTLPYVYILFLLFFYELLLQEVLLVRIWARERIDGMMSQEVLVDLDVRISYFG